ncbi:hypothetical protein HJFPF1_03419 [Paramyrothecium foliicola]|nr:hypothetical protein HJFPF1_03419 [Paramyrothecium foliicola]
MEEVVGRRVLGEIEEMSLEEVLESLRAAVHQSTTTTTTTSTVTSTNNLLGPNITSTVPLHPSLTRRLKLTYVSDLDEIAARHTAATYNPAISIAGRSLPLIYIVIAALVSPPHCRAVLIIDLEGCFDPTRLTCAAEDLRHVYVQRAARRSNLEDVRALVTQAVNWMMYGGQTAPRIGESDPGEPGASFHHHASAGRPLWGTIVLGSSHGAAGDITSSWRGWMRVDRTAVSAFAVGSSAQEAMGRRSARQEVVDAVGWAATSPWGSFAFTKDTVD